MLQTLSRTLVVSSRLTEICYEISTRIFPEYTTKGPFQDPLCYIIYILLFYCQPLKFIQQGSKLACRCMDRFGRGHVYSSFFQGINREGATAGLQEA